MTLASLFRPAPATPSGGRHAAPDTGQEDRVADLLAVRPGRHAAPEDDDATDATAGEDASEEAAEEVIQDAGDDASDAVTERSGDLLDALGFRYDD